MSQLALAADGCVADEPRILSFLEFLPTFRPEPTVATPERARTIHSNRCCPTCNRATVEQIELRDGALGRNGRMIPGTGTLVGFSCNACGHEWPVK